MFCEYDEQKARIVLRITRNVHTRYMYISDPKFHTSTQLRITNYQQKYQKNLLQLYLHYTMNSFSGTDTAIGRMCAGPDYGIGIVGKSLPRRGRRAYERGLHFEHTLANKIKECIQCLMFY